MPPSEDERLEAYLKKFQPRAVEPFQLTIRERPSWRWQLAARWVIATAAIMILAVATGVLLRRGEIRNAEEKPKIPAVVERAVVPATLAEANELLVHSPSFKGTLDRLAFRADSPPTVGDKQSAISVLGQEKTKL